MIYSPSDYVENAKPIQKALYLAKLTKAGLPVPDFVVIELADGFDSSVEATEVINRLPSKQYAVRFAGCDEDGATTSAAGKYTSLLAVDPRDLAAAITHVIATSRAKNPDIEHYVLIVQVYIEAICSGVAFSRHPESLTAQCVEYSSGSGAVVAGLTATRLDITPETNVASLPSPVTRLLPLIAHIERLFNYPQDIEWCFTDDTVYILQSRPITTISASSWQGVSYINDAVAGRTDYSLVTGSSVESYAYPTPLDLSILKMLYEEGGAAASAYSALGFTYTATNQFVMIGNRLYVDALREQQMLFPSYIQKAQGEFGLRVLPLSKFVTTAMNQVRYAREVMPPVAAKVVNNFLQTLLQPLPVLEKDVSQYLQEHYTPIFALNVLIRNSKVIALTPDQEACIRAYSLPTDLQIGITKGNSLALADTSPFLCGDIRTLVQSDALRELARYQSVRLRQVLDSYVVAKAALVNLPHELIAFSTVEELETKTITREIAYARKVAEEQAAHSSFPDQITSYIPKSNNEIVILSPGVASGTVCTVDTVNQTAGSKILYVEALTPETVTYFHHVQGIICRQGGLLSHAAIVARERKLPVVQSSGFVPHTGDYINLPNLS